MRCEIEYLVKTYGQNLFAAALSITHNAADAEDACQNTWLKYLNSSAEFTDEEHLRAWLFKVVINQSKDILRSFWRRNRTDLEDWMKEQQFACPEDQSLAEAVLALPAKYSSVLHLYYYEDYSVREISEIAGISENTAKSRLHRGRALLKKKLEQENREEYAHE